MFLSYNMIHHLRCWLSQNVWKKKCKEPITVKKESYDCTLSWSLCSMKKKSGWKNHVQVQFKSKLLQHLWVFLISSRKKNMHVQIWYFVMSNLVWAASCNVMRLHHFHATESISSLADLYSSSRLAMFVRFSMSAGSSSNIAPSLSFCTHQREHINYISSTSLLTHQKELALKSEKLTSCLPIWV